MSKSLPWAGFAAPLILGLAILGSASLLTGCAMPEVRDHVQLGASRIALQMTPEKALELRVGDGPVMPLADHVAARIEGAWVVGAHRLVLLQGETPQCRLLQTLVVVKDDHATTRPLGRCEDRFAVTWNGELLAARQIGVRDPVVWRFRDGALSGPTVEPTLNGRRGRGAPADSLPVDSLEQPAPVEPAPAVPPVSRPVGDDVIPAPVGGGPLPRPIETPRLF